MEPRRIDGAESEPSLAARCRGSAIPPAFTHTTAPTLWRARCAPYAPARLCRPIGGEPGEVAQTGIVRQAFSNGQTALTRHQDGANAIVDVVPAAFDHGFARRRGDMDRHIPDEEIAASARLLIRCRIAVVLKIALTERAIELRPDHVLHHRAGVVDAMRRFLTVFSLAQHVADDRAQTARGVQADFEGFGGEKLVNALYKTIIGRTLRARTLLAQKVEARVRCKVLNRMTALGMPVSRGSLETSGRATVAPNLRLCTDATPCRARK